MRFSAAFRIDKTQAELDFVDVDLGRDTPLFVDPFALSIRKDAWSYQCTQHVLSFFQTAIDAIHSGDDTCARQTLTNLSEPNETRLGLSRGEPSGRGIGGKQEYDLYAALRVRLETHGWAFRRSRLPPMATRMMASETSMRAS